jgi:hypothetical protein
MAESKTTKTKNTPTFKLKQLEESEKYAAMKDMLRVTLDPEKSYTAEEVDEILAKTLARPVHEEVNP